MGNDQAKTPPKPQPAPAPKPDPLLEENWRPFSFQVQKKHDMIDALRSFKISNPEVQHLRILVHGPIGAGKSSFVNSIDSIFQGRMSQGALVDTLSGTSFTKTLHTQRIKEGKSGRFLPFVISDIMGLENTTKAGAHISDINKALEGHLRDGHKFAPGVPLKEGDPDYNSSPALGDKVHCLVSVLPANKITLMDDADTDDVIAKLREIRKTATTLRIPQVILMTYVDDACPIVKRDLRMIYKSKKIKEKMQECSNKLGIPMTSIFPVKNYHEEIDLDNDTDILLLTALKNIVNFADDHVGEKVNK